MKTILMDVVPVLVLFVLFCWGLCAAAGRADEEAERMFREYPFRND